MSIRDNWLSVYKEKNVALQEKELNPMDYTPDAEKSKFEPRGYRAKLLTPDGRVSYLSAAQYKSPADAKKAAKVYRANMKKTMRQLDMVMADHEAKHALKKDQKVDEETLREGIDQKAFAAGAKAIKSYAMRSGGIDKKDFLEVAKMLDQISRINILQAGQVIARLNRFVNDRDTDVRDRIYAELRGVGLMESAEQVDENLGAPRNAAHRRAMFTAKSKFTDKQIKMAYGIINDPRYKGGNMTAIVRKIEQIAKGLSKHPNVEKAIQATNEDYERFIDQVIQEEIDYLDSLDENYEESDMMLNQVEAMEHFLDGIHDFIMETEDAPEWYQNKLTMAYAQLQSLYSYSEGEDDDDDEEMDESTKAYGDSLRKMERDRQMKMMKPGEMDKLKKIRAMLDKEKKKK